MVQQSHANETSTVLVPQESEKKRRKKGHLYEDKRDPLWGDSDLKHCVTDCESVAIAVTSM